MNCPLLSVVIPTYNRSNKVELILLELSKLKVSEHLKVVVVDDNSDTPNKNRLKILEERYQWAVFIYQVNNLGASAARNRGIGASRSEWVWFFDDDDFVHADVVAIVLDQLKENIFNEDLLLMNMKKRFKNDELDEFISPSEGNLRYKFSRYGHDVNTSSAIFRRDLLYALEGWDEKLKAGQDTDIFLRASNKTLIGKLSGACVIVDVSSDDRMTKNPKKQVIGKVQFLRKNWSLLHWRRRLRYTITILTIYPYIKYFYSHLVKRLSSTIGMSG